MSTPADDSSMASRAAASHRTDDDRWEWVEHLVPIQFLRVLWNGLFPSRFRAMVLEGIDGTPAKGYARPLTFCLGCWLLLYSVVNAFPLGHGVAAALTALPAVERQQLAQRLGIDTIAGVVISPTAKVEFGKARHAVVVHLRDVLHKRVRNASSAEIASYVETHGDKELGLRVRGYASLADRPELFTESTLVLFVVFGLVPCWWIAHLVLASPRRSFRETRYVYMYNDSWLLVFFFCPLMIFAAGDEALSGIELDVLGPLCALALLFWLARTPRLFKATHAAALWRIIVAQMCVFALAFAMMFVASIGRGMWIGLLRRWGF